MPDPGDKARGPDVGLSRSSVYWVQCPRCGWERWAEARLGSNTNRLCKECNTRVYKDKTFQLRAKV